METEIDRMEQRWMLDTLRYLYAESNSLLTISIPSGSDIPTVLNHIDLEQNRVELEDPDGSRTIQRALEVSRHAIGYIPDDHNGAVVYAGVDSSGTEHDIIMWDLDPDEFSLDMGQAFDIEAARDLIPDPPERVRSVAYKFSGGVDADPNIVAGPAPVAEAIAYEQASTVVTTPKLRYSRSSGLRNMILDAESKGIEVVVVPRCVDGSGVVSDRSIGAFLDA
jgi:hypothetical protein